ncbi:MAG: cysteine-rich small domain-containing protein [Candidatus Hydrothermarchaeales archaeon]
MLEKAKSQITEVIESGVLVTEEECEYYPCHFKGQDCSWCFCPFYPCLDEKTGGKYIKAKKTGKDVWSCIDCHWVHNKEVSEVILESMKSLENWTDLATCNKIRVEILGD